MKKQLSAILTVLMLCGMLTGYAALAEQAAPLEISEEDFDFTPKVVAPEANQAGMGFLALPEIDMFAEQLQTALDNGFNWTSNEVDGSYTKYVSGMPNQLAAEGSGFEFSLSTTADDADAIRPAMGFSALFYFTADEDNLGEETYGKLAALCDTLEVIEGSWVLPEASALQDLGIHIYTLYNGQPQDITDRASFGISIAEKADGKLLFNYGAVMVDRAIDDFAAEGIPLEVSLEEEMIWSDGAKDGTITGTWWIGK